LSKSFPFGAGAALLPPLLTLTVISLAACIRQPQQTEKPLSTPQTSPSATSAVPENPATADNQGVAQPPKQSQSGVGTYSGTGVITLVNRKEGWVEINHGEIKGLMPAMQMAWFVKTVSLIGSIKVGDTVDFEIEYNRGREVLTKIEKVQSR
jgi:Cu/Ag efflux protein CusF